MKSVFKRIGSYWCQNATKRWLLALDRFSGCILFLIFSALVQCTFVLPEDSFVMLFASLSFLFILFYTPPYMFPGSDEEVGRKRKG